MQACVWVVPGYLIGGEKKKAEKARLRKGINILIATSGRLIDHIHHTESLSLAKVKYLVIDEADRLLEMGYERSVTRYANVGSYVGTFLSTYFDHLSYFFLCLHNDCCYSK